MYIITTVTLAGEEYEVGAEVDAYGYEDSRLMGSQYEVGEPSISAPDCALKLSSLVDYHTLPDDWSGIVEDELIAAYEGKCQDDDDSAADYAHDCAKEELDY